MDEIFGRKDIYDTGYDRLLNKVGVSEQSSVSSGLASGSPVSDSVVSTSIMSGSMADIMFCNKRSFTDLSAGWIQGIDRDGIYKWMIGDSAQSIDWSVTTVGTLTIKGTIVATLGTIGGFTIGATTLTATNLILDSSGQRISLGTGNDIIILDADHATTRLWIGHTDPASASFAVTKAGVMSCTSATVTGALTTGAGSSIDGTYLSAGSVTSGKANVALRGWTYSGAFSSVDLDTVAWASGTFTASDGTAYAITGSNTGNMAAKTYVYLDIAVSTTLFQVTTTATTAVGDGKVLIATAQNGAVEPVYMVFSGSNEVNINASSIVSGSITANEIAASTITSGKMSVTTLSSMAADLGSITAGTITLSAAGHIKAGQTDFDTGTGFWLGIAAGPTPKFSIGNSAGNKLTWDGSGLTLIGTVNGQQLSQEHVFGDGSDGDVVISGDTTLTRTMFYDDLTVDSTRTLNNAGYFIYVRGTLTVNGTISNSGTVGGNGGNGTTGGLAGTAGSGGVVVASGEIYGGLAGVAGGKGGEAGIAAVVGVTGTSQTVSMITASGATGGTGGAGGGPGGAGAAGGPGGSSVLAVRYNPLTVTYAQTMTEAASISLLRTAPASGGGGGGGMGTPGDASSGTGGGGGGSGSQGGGLVIFAKSITVAAGGKISSIGGVGGNGGNGGNALPNRSGGGGGGGGAGGNGGVILMCYASLTNLGTISVLGGAGGTKGNGGTNGGGTGLPGQPGNDGSSGTIGRIIYLQV